MQVVPMGTMDRPTTSVKTTNAQVVRMVQLEGKTRLPQRIQEAVVDIGNLMMAAQQSGPNGETTTMHTTLRATAGTESVLNNTAYSLKRLETAVEKASHRNALIERSVPQLSDALAKLQDISHVCRRINEDVQPKLPTVKK